MSLATPDRLLAEPELAVLELLDLTLQQTIYALFAAHPELIGGDLEYCHTTTPQLWIADAIYNSASALQHTIDRYRQVSEATRNRISDPDDF